jgi:hypothetical protein
MLAASTPRTFNFDDTIVFLHYTSRVILPAAGFAQTILLRQ